MDVFKDVFKELIVVNVNDHTEKKEAGGKEFTYLSWPWAWAEIKKRYPDATYDIWRNPEGLPYVFDPKTGYMVFTSVTIKGQTHMMWLSVMDGANKAMLDKPYDYKVKNPNYKYAKLNPADGKRYDKWGTEQPEFFTKRVEQTTMTDINKALMRCLVKNLAMHGLGLYIYAGEDLPEGETPDVGAQPVEPADNVRPENNDVPTTRPAVSKTNKVPAPENPVVDYLAQMCAYFGEEYGLDEKTNKKLFNDRRLALMKAGLAPMKPAANYTMEEAMGLVDAMNKCFDIKSAELKTK